MATTSMSFGNSGGRLRKVGSGRTYGKSSRDRVYNVNDDLFSTEGSDDPLTTWPTTTAVEKRKPIQKTYSGGGGGGGKLVSRNTALHKPTRTADVEPLPSAFDVPVSDEERDTRPGSKKCPPQLEKRAQISETTDDFDMLVWEDEEVDKHTNSKRRHGTADTAKAQGRSEKKVGKLQSKVQRAREMDEAQAARKRRRTTPTSSRMEKLLSDQKPTQEQQKTLKPSVVIPGPAPRGNILERNPHKRDARAISPLPPPSDMSAPTQATKQLPTRKRAKTPAISDTRPNLAKGASSPAVLQGMLAVRTAKPSTLFKVPPPPKSPESWEDPEESMYSPSTHAKPQTSHLTSPKPVRPLSGSVTPKQAQLWKDLLADEVESPGTALASSRLQSLVLDSHKKPQPAPSFGRSISSISQPSNSRRARLIDTLIDDAPSSDMEYDSDQSSKPENGAKDSHKSVLSINEASYSSATNETLKDKYQSSQSESLPTGSQGIAGSGTGPKVTYGRQRSYLQEATLEAELEMALPMDNDSLFSSNSMNRGARKMPASLLQSKSALSIPEDDEDDSIIPIRSIHDLRASGTNKRFENEVEALIEDIEDSSASARSRRRSGMMELCTKLADEKFAVKLVDHGLDRRLFAPRRMAADPIFGFAMAAAVGYISRVGVSVNVGENIIQTKVLSSLSFLFNESADITRLARDRKNNMSKVAQTSVTELKTFIIESPLFKDPKPQSLSPQCIALRGTEMLVRNLRKQGSLMEALDSNIISTILKIMSDSASNLQDDVGPESDILSLKLSLSILESASLGGDRQTMSSPELVTLLYHGLAPIFRYMQQLPPKVTSLAVRLCLNVTNNNPKASETFSGPGLVSPLVSAIIRGFNKLATEEDDAVREELLDGLILALGAMINLAEYSDTARFTALQGGGSGLEELVGTFRGGLERTSQADSFQESQLNVPYGYLNVLLANLCLNEGVRLRVCSLLPGNSLHVLISAGEEFIRYHQKVDNEEFETEEGHDVWAAFTARLQAVVDRLKILG